MGSFLVAGGLSMRSCVYISCALGADKSRVVRFRVSWACRVSVQEKVVSSARIVRLPGV